MSHPLPSPHDQFVVSHGKSGAVGVFTAPAPLPLRRGQAVVLETTRGIEIGSILRPASLLQARVLGATSSGLLLRPLTSDDETQRLERAALEQSIFDTSRSWRSRDGLTIEILDVDLLFDGRLAIIQFVGPSIGTEMFAESLQDHFALTVRLENLAQPMLPDGEDHAHGCDKPDCGRTADSGSGCSTCSTGGCGSAKVDIREYFGHLRDRMETNQRIPLV